MRSLTSVKLAGQLGLRDGEVIIGLFDTVTSMLRNAIKGEAGLGGALTSALEQFGGMDKIVGQLTESGLGEKVNSWLGKGENMPVSAEEITSAIGLNKLKEMASWLGIPVDTLSGLVAQHLPAAVDAASPEGKLESPEASGQ